MKTIEFTRTFKKDFRRELGSQHGKKVEALLERVIALLAEGGVLDAKFRDHPLTGNWSDHRDCHLRPDLVLIYKVSASAVTLVRLGSHSELFG